MIVFFVNFIVLHFLSKLASLNLWEDGAQASAGALLILFGLTVTGGGTVILIGATALFIWELVETLQP